MAAYNKFFQFVEDLGLGVHNFHATTGHVLKVYASAAVPSQSADAVKADLAEITAANGYPAGGSDIQNVWAETTGTATLTATDVTWTASGGPFGPLQYIVLYNDTPTTPADPLIAWWDYGTSITVNDGESFTTDFGANVFTLA
jgi:hypothetical protein